MEINLFREANSSSATDIINSTLWAYINYCVHKSIPPATRLRQMNPLQNLPSCFFNIHFNIISSLRSSQVCVSFAFPLKILYVYFFTPIRTTCFFPQILPDFIILIISGWEDKLCCPLLRSYTNPCYFVRCRSTYCP